MEFDARRVNQIQNLGFGPWCHPAGISGSDKRGLRWENGTTGTRGNHGGMTDVVQQLEFFVHFKKLELNLLLQSHSDLLH